MLLGFLMAGVFAATSTKLGKLQPIGRGLLILSRCVVTALAFTTLEHNVIARHNLSYFKLRSLYFVLGTLFLVLCTLFLVPLYFVLGTWFFETCCVDFKAQSSKHKVPSSKLQVQSSIPPLR